MEILRNLSIGLGLKISGKIMRPGVHTNLWMRILLKDIPVPENSRISRFPKKWLQYLPIIHTDVPGREFPHCDYEIYPTTPWAYGFAGTEIEVEEQAMEDFPFSPKGPPVSLLVPCMPVKWESSGGCAAPLPASRTAVGPVEIKRFLPYGCTNLRMTELPFLGK